MKSVGLNKIGKKTDNMNKKALMKRMVVALVAVGFVAAFLSLAHVAQKQVHGDTLCFGESCVEVEIAVSPEEIRTGLMNRASLPESGGMLFVFGNEGAHMFWMKNTLIPLDIIWMDDDGRVVYIENDAQPCRTPTCPTHGPKVSSKYVLEVNAGYAEKYNINTGDKAQITTDKLFQSE